MKPTSLVQTAEPLALRAWADGRMIFIDLADGRQVGFHSDRFKLLKKATDAQLKEVKIEVNGYALRWEEIDEDILVEDVANGRFQLPL